MTKTRVAAFFDKVFDFAFWGSAGVLIVWILVMCVALMVITTRIAWHLVFSPS